MRALLNNVFSYVISADDVLDALHTLGPNYGGDIKRHMKRYVPPPRDEEDETLVDAVLRQTVGS